MSDQTRSLILQHWRLANERRWDAFGRLLHPELFYEVPQTRECIETGAGYLEMFSTWPGDWRVEVQHLVCEGVKAVCVIDFTVGAETLPGISIFELEGPLIARITEYWPEAYDPPPRMTPHLKRRPAA